MEKLIVNKNFTPREWGPYFWKFLINIAQNYPEQFTSLHSRQIELFLTQLQFVLPCPACRKHYHDYLSQYPPNIHSRYEMIYWLYILYNTIKARENYFKTYQDFLKIANDYTSVCFWNMMYYICVSYSNNTFDNQLSYKQFFEYLGYLIPMFKFQKAFKKITIDPYLINDQTLLYYITIIHNEIQRNEFSI